jgi:Flp pilus assembly protein TadG
MKPPAIRRSLSPRHKRESGVTILLVAVALVSIMGMAALSIDGVTLYLARAEAQRAADAAALTAARVISLSGITGDPSNSTRSWGAICGGSSGTATLAAQAVAQKNPIGGVSIPTTSITVKYSAGSGETPRADCSGLSSAFGVNPVVTVQVQRADLPTFFSRIWGRTGSSVSATASAEAFNPSNSVSVGGAIVPVRPRCVKPWIVPNRDPGNCPGGGCLAFVNPTTGGINNAGILPNGPGVIGESFSLLADCNGPGATCTLAGTPTPPPPQANILITSTSSPPNNPGTPNLEYVPGAAVNSSAAVAANSSAACAAVSAAVSQYPRAIAGCDKTTVYACGGPTLAAVDLSENPSGAAGDTANGAKCLINQAGGQDTLGAGAFPFVIQAYGGNPLVATGAVTNGDEITSSNSIVSLPIYDDTASVITQAGPNNVTVVGFLQVFINFVDTNGNVSVTVLNVSGCGNDPSKPPLLGSSPVPVRLITQP